MVIYGNVNNLFQDISRITHTVGDLALCKAFFLHSPSGGIILYFFFQKGVALTLTVRPSYLRSRGLKYFLRITLILDHCSDIS